MKIIKAESRGINLRVYFDDGSARLFCNKAIDDFYQSIGGFGVPTGKEFNLKKFLRIQNRQNISNK